MSSLKVGGEGEAGAEKGKEGLTVFVSKNKDEYGLQSEEVEEIPGQGGYPPNVEVACCNAGLEHRFEAEGEWEGELHCLPPQKRSVPTLSN